MPEIEYLTAKNGAPQAVVIPIEFWQRLFSEEDIPIEELSKKIEDYCLNQAVEEVKQTPLLDREAALKYLEE